MSNYKRYHNGRLYFFTLVTFRREFFLTSDLGRQSLRNAFERVRTRHPFIVNAMCLLPDHIHFIMELPNSKNDFSIRISLIKRFFTRAYLSDGGKEANATESMIKHGNRGIWQKRFWEHKIRDYEDYQNHVNYIHFNPVKHKLVKEASDWPWSTYHRYKMSGLENNSTLNEKDFDFIE